MKKMILVTMMMMSVTASAVPRGLFLATPELIQVKGDKLTLTMNLPCQNENPDEWTGNLIHVWDDEGDAAIAFAVVLSTDECKFGPKRIFKFSYNIENHFQDKSMIELIKSGDAELVPADLAKTNLKNK